MRPILFVRNRMSTDARLGCKAGPGRTQSLRETPSPSCAEASNTILDVVVVFVITEHSMMQQVAYSSIFIILIRHYLCKSFLYIFVDCRIVSFSSYFAVSVIQESCLFVKKFSIGLITVFDAILTSRQTREKLQCLHKNLMSNNFRKTAVLKKYEL